MAQPFTAAHRALQGWTTPVETRLLRALAVRLPGRVTADHLTALGALAMAAGSAAYAASSAWPAALLVVNLCLVVNWLGDSLDGTVARVRGQERPRYGFYVDHVLDSAGITVLVAGMGASGLMSPLVAAGFLVAYLLVSVETFLATYCLARFRMSVAGMGPTELRLLLMIGNLVALWKPVVTIAGHPVLLFDAGGLVAMTALVAIFITAAIANGRRLFIEEPVQGQR